LKRVLRRFLEGFLTHCLDSFRLVTATKARRSCCVMVVNETKHTLHLINADCSYSGKM